MDITTMIVAIAVCVILPVLIVWFAMRARQHEVNRKAEILIKAMEAGIPIDQELLKPSKKTRGIKQGLLDKLTGACVMSAMGIALLLLHFFVPGSLLSGYAGIGCLFIAIGIALFVGYFVGKKMLAKEIEAEEKELDNKSE